jgi:CRISPR-associated endonuclease/helicase Cas3
VQPFTRIPEHPEESMNSDSLSETEGQTQTLAEHTSQVVGELQLIVQALKHVELNGTRSSLERAARYHDWGKAHHVFQQTLHKEDLNGAAPNPLLAKQDRKLSRGKHSRDWFRHELASALALMKTNGEFLDAYIAAAHHGKVRVNIRSMPGEVVLRDPRARIARGIESGDRLFAADLGGGTKVPETELDLTVTELGNAEGSRGWSDRVEDLLDEYGPFRLAYLEMLLRAADETASRNAPEGKR